MAVDEMEVDTYCSRNGMDLLELEEVVGDFLQNVAVKGIGSLSCETEKPTRDVFVLKPSKNSRIGVISLKGEESKAVIFCACPSFVSLELDGRRFSVLYN